MSSTDYDTELEALFAEHERIGDRIIDMKQRKAKVVFDSLYGPKRPIEFTAKAIMSEPVWDLECLEDSTDHYQAREGWIRDRFDGVISISGYFPDTNQHALRVALVSDTDCSQVAKWLGEFIPYMKPLGDYEKKISVFESTLSRWGTYDLICQGSQWKLMKTTYGREEILQEFDNLIEALEYIKTNHPYERENDDDYEDDYYCEC